jgi:hypothetical protein
MLWGLLLVLMLGACSRHAATPPAVPTATAGATQAPAAADPGEGPRLTMSPDGVHIEYRVLGHGDPTVILVHGWACDANYWNEQLAALTAHYTVITREPRRPRGLREQPHRLVDRELRGRRGGSRERSAGHTKGAGGHAMGCGQLARRPAHRAAGHRHRRRRGAALLGEPPLSPPEIARRVAPFQPTSSVHARRPRERSLFAPTPTARWCRRSPTTCRC